MKNEGLVELVDNLEELPEVFRENYREKSDFFCLFKISAPNEFDQILLGVYEDYLYVMKDTGDGIEYEKRYYKDVSISVLQNPELILTEQK